MEPGQLNFSPDATIPRLCLLTTTPLWTEFNILETISRFQRILISLIIIVVILCSFRSAVGYNLVVLFTLYLSTFNSFIYYLLLIYILFIVSNTTFTFKSPRKPFTVKFISFKYLLLLLFVVNVAFQLVTVIKIIILYDHLLLIIIFLIIIVYALL